MGGMADARGQEHCARQDERTRSCPRIMRPSLGHHSESVTKFDAQMAAFRPALALIEYLLKNQYYQGPIIVLGNTKATVPKFMDTRPGPDQPTILDIAWH